MKILQILFFVAMTLPTFGQSKTDLINCLNLIFDRSEFQPAYSSHDATDGNVIISRTGSRYQMGKKLTLNNLINSLSQDDFRDTDNYIKVITGNELENQGIPLPATLRIFGHGTESGMNLSFETTHFNEAQQYSWNYRLIKIDEQWEITGNSFNKRAFELREY